MRYAIYYTPSMHDPLSVAAASWLGRNVYSGEACEPPSIPGFSRQEVAFHTAVPRRYGFHGTIKAPFRLHPDETEASLLKFMMQFASAAMPFEIPRLEVSRLGSFYGLMSASECAEMNYFAASVVEAFDRFRAPLSEAEIDRRDSDSLTAPQFANLHRWGFPYVMDEFRFHMMLTGALHSNLRDRFEKALREYFGHFLSEPIKVASLALFIEPEPGAPLRVHSQHPLGKLSAHRPSLRRKGQDDNTPNPATEQLAALAMRLQAG
ncbi:putative phosphonate metabolism protein [Pararhizobium capsulatum DSM 1112]|uniref:Phosphonate metabolism protein n=1 Tax=Pararhizobium capsulatum DSM 1112 TaxID=1121113 RepID=A0ABU0BSS4_9HYPH|nr:DUF1045 domain-containing protein [Pararhizobium capsulatum]MDQ0321311.1 putative phosphonate metabolism protein [Pararhizobium capsulatum DSM 1112]